MTNTTQDHYTVIGNPINHSKSPLIHRLFAEQTHQQLDYTTTLAPLDGFQQTIRQLIKQGYKGCNITVPFKLQAFELADQLSARAQAAGAVNTFHFQQGKIVADNTDGIGMVNDIQQNLGVSLTNKRILLVGAGGAAQGVLLPLVEQQPAQLVISNRSIEKAIRLQQQIAPQAQACTFNQLAGQQFDVIINATSAGLSDSQLPLPEQIFAPGSLAYDMMYGRQTPFMALAAAQQAQVADGLGMLVGQAAEAFYIWRGVRPDTKTVIQQLRQ